MRDPQASTFWQRSAPWWLALGGFAVDIAAFWPGQMSFDSAYAWWQVRGGITSDIVPPMFVWVWRVCNALLAGPGLLFVLHLLLFWGGLALLLRALRYGPVMALVVMIGVAFAPVPWLLRSHAWTDVGLFSALTFATGAFACAKGPSKRCWLALALPALLYAGALRHNALPALLPFAAWFGWLAVRDRALSDSPVRRAVRLALPAVALIASIGVITLAANATVQRRVPMWPMIAEWDLAAISIATDHVLLPDFMIGPGLDVPDLAQAFREWSTTALLQNTRHGLRDPIGADFSTEELSSLRHAWLAAITAHPTAWLAHRWRLTRALFGTHAPDWPHELVYVDDEVAYRDNPPIARNTNALHETLMHAAAALAITSVLAPWPYLLLGLAALPIAWRRRPDPSCTIALILLASAWLYALPFTLIAASAELRYLGWPCVASLLAFACAAFAPRSVSR